MNFVQKLTGCFSFSDLQLLGSKVLVTMTDLLLLEICLFDRFGLFWFWGFVIDDFINHFYQTLLRWIVWMSRCWRNDWWNFRFFILWKNFGLSTPGIFYRLIQDRLLLDFVIILGLWQWYSFGLESVGIKRLSDSITLFFDLQRWGKLFSDLLGMLLFNLL